MELLFKEKFLKTFLLFFLLFIVSCDNYDDEFNEIRNEISSIKGSLLELQNAYDSGKIITSVKPVENTASGNWVITFSDNSTIEITSGRDGITPCLMINENNYWEVSYDGGSEYGMLLDSNGLPVPATGKSGLNGCSVRVTVNDDGYYVLETYDPNTATVVDSIVTPYSNDSSCAIKSIVKDRMGGTTTITMQSGEVYVFRHMYYYPSSIIVFEKEVSLEYGGNATVEFRINPSNAFLDFDKVKLDLVGHETRTTVSYITPPVSYSIESITNSLDENGNVKRGQYVVTIKDCETGKDYSDKVAIVIATEDNQGEPMEVTSDLISVSSKYPSSLPRVFVTTPNGAGIDSKYNWLENSTIRIVDEKSEETLNIKTSIKGRGNTSWNYPKKPYTIKLKSEAEVLGMPKHKRWVLLANWMDRTLLRNDVAYEMARRVMDWAPRGKFVELYLNGKHQGNYYLCEQISVGENRVNIDALDEDADFNDSSLITGGYILEYDRNNPQTGDVNYFYTTIKNYPVTIKDPDGDVITSWEHPGYLYVKDYINNLEKILEDDKYDLVCWNDVAGLIDVQSFIDWWLVHELARNYEPVHPKSSYMYKKRDGKLYAGPVWDFDWLTFTDQNKGAVFVNSVLYYRYLFKYPEFRLIVKERWTELKDTFANIENYILEQSEYIRVSNEVNISKWPITSVVNGDETLTFDEAVEKMRLAFKSRLETVEKYVSSLN